MPISLTIVLTITRRAETHAHTAWDDVQAVVAVHRAHTVDRSEQHTTDGVPRFSDDTSSGPGTALSQPEVPHVHA
jgi:hypothetical protein